MRASRILHTLKAAFAFAENCDPIEGDWLIDFMIDGFKDILNRDARFPRLTPSEFELLIADLRRSGERKAEVHFKVAANDFRKLVITETMHTLEDA